MGSDLLYFAAVGFLAQLVDGALGMAFGLICSSSLLAFGLPPAVASAAVHTAEMVTTGLSGLSHLYHRNVEKRLFLPLAVAGVLGGVTGAFLLVGLPEHAIRGFVAAYLVCMALLILGRALGHFQLTGQPPLVPLGASGGFLDAVGGGGWGPIVTSTLLASGSDPRRAIGSVNCAEFFVTVAISATLLLHLDISQLGRVVLGLILGGALAAPLAGYLLRIMPQRAVLGLVALVVSFQAGLAIWRLLRA
ncbi:sulfite exporter TauE/SafE family protein [Roseomonas sp. M0104]|uniref:Probable membrane transporter protein n=1 Tax=Teichococcus coralli TaxID=2545983 RepID=A0A845BEL2_9PROT|nr:sulfite exporter TauE/SafE family protein [Pseudoroseomonas coralli]MXP65395.1 sulfite exporter TauE/SafE family protein [Pseudoroseomonas coralli]